MPALQYVAISSAIISSILSALQWKLHLPYQVPSSPLRPFRFGVSGEAGTAFNLGQALQMWGPDDLMRSAG